MAINIFDDEVLKQNKRFISNEKKEETLIEKSIDSGVTEFGILYDSEVEGGVRKAIENPKRNIEISLSSTGIRTPSEGTSDPRTNEVSFHGFEKDIRSRKWNELSSPNPGITKDNINIDLANRESLANSYSVSDDEETKNIILEGFERGEGGKWIKSRDGINKDTDNLENRESLLITNEIVFTDENNEISFLKLKDKNQQLLDPDDAIEGEFYTPILVARRDKSEIDISLSNKEIKLEGFEKLENGKWKKIFPSVGTNNAGINKDLADVENKNPNEVYFSSSENIPLEAKNITLEGFEKLENGKWKKIFPSVGVDDAGIQKNLAELENKNPDEVYFSSSENIPLEVKNSSILKLQDTQGNLIDPDNAVEEEEYTPVLVGRGDKREILSEFGRNLTNFTYNKIYQNDFWEANNWFGEGRAAIPGSPLGERTVNASDLEIREKTDNAFMGLTTDRVRELSIFLFMLFPYIGTSTVLNIRNAIASPDIVGLATSSSQNAYYLLQNMRYFTPFELAKYFLHNFYTMHFMKEMTIKYAPGRVPTGAPNARQWDGRPDIFHGRENSALFYLKQLHNLGSLFRRPAEDLGDGSAALTQYKDGGENAGDGPNVLPFGSSEPLSPKIRLWGTWNSSKRKTSPTDIFGDSNPMEETKDVFVVSIPNIRVVGNKWHIDSFGENSREDLEGYEEYYNIAFRNISGENENIINTDVLNTKGYYPQFGDDGKWNEIPENGIPEDQTKNYNNYEIAEKKNFIEAKGFDLNDDVLNINLDTFKYLDNPPEGAGEPKATGETVRDAIKRRSTERDDINSLQIGSILVAPVVSEGFAESLPRFHIPFEFNPEINEGGLAANYEATSVLSRIGELQSYQGTGTFTITLETEYIATAHPEDNEVSTDGNNWMNFYTLEKIQAIEKAYRSLVLPHFPDETNIEQGYFYVKPPLLRVIMGGANDEPADTGPYANLLTYGRNEMVTGRLESAGSFFNSNSRLKNFIATEVTIIKDLKETPIVLDKKGRIKDTMGFKVSLSLTEVTANYMDSIPDFKRYSDVYKNTMNNFVVNG